MGSDHAQVLITTCEGEKGSVLTAEDLGVEQVTAANALRAAFELWLSETLPVFWTLLSKEWLLKASPAKDRLWEEGGKIWFKAQN